ncbi:MAG: HEAT repeat domain-containing protein [Planctomycetota bacterium]
MRIRRLFLVTLLGGGPLLAQEGQPEAQSEPAKEDPAKPKAEEVSFTDQEIVNFLDTFDKTYKNKDLPPEDAVSTLVNLKSAYAFLEAKGAEKTKDQEKLQKSIVDHVRKGLTAKKRGIVNIECARALGELGDEDGAPALVKWLEVELEEKSPNPQSIEYGFQALAYIGPQDKATLEFALDYASKGKHPDNTVAANAIKACYQWKKLDAKTRKEFFDKICMYLEGLHSGATGGDPKRRGTYETRYKAVETEGKDALRELGDGTTTFEDPRKARAWFNDNKKQKWEPYVGPHFRKAAAPAAGGAKEGGDAKPEG